MRSIKPKAIAVSVDEGQHSVYNPDFLRKRTRWIRDDLDPQIARNGHDALHADDILKVDEFLRQLLTAKIGLDDIRRSRVHIAVSEIAGLGTRWPKRLIERSDTVREAWEPMYGRLTALGFPLYEPGGRLHDVCEPEDLSKEKLIMKWLKSHQLGPIRALRFGDIGFKPGDWWINPLFAFRDGIINGGESEGGVVADLVGGYAVVMTGVSEESSPTPNEFVYRARSSEKGRYRLTAGTPDSRHPVRILRSHTLRSFWAPKAGLRYDGLHKVAGWNIKMDPKTKEMVYLISFKRLADQPAMSEVLRRPWTEEIEDYREYKRLRQLARQKITEAAKAQTYPSRPTMTTMTVSTDGVMDVYDGAVVECLLGRMSEESDPDWTILRHTAVTSAGFGPAGVPTTADTLQNADVAGGTRSDSIAGHT